MTTSTECPRRRSQLAKGMPGMDAGSGSKYWLNMRMRMGKALNQPGRPERNQVKVAIVRPVLRSMRHAA